MISALFPVIGHCLDVFLNTHPSSPENWDGTSLIPPASAQKKCSEFYQHNEGSHERPRHPVNDQR